MTDKHTPGPWDVQGDTYVTVNSLIIAHCKQAGRTSLDEAMANARLIAAAPDLLAALEKVIDYHVTGINPLSDAAILSARAAIARARGES